MANGTLKVSNIQTSSGSGTITLGQSGETITIPSGVTQTNIGGVMTPAFEAQRPQSAQVVSNNTDTKVQFSTENFDTDNCYDNSTNYRFTPNVAGKYFVYARIMTRAETNGQLVVGVVSLKKNGTTIGSTRFDNGSNKVNNKTPVINQIVDMNGSSDYIECFGEVSVGSGNAQFYNDSAERTIFGAYKIIGA
jgi:hypothetical protein